MTNLFDYYCGKDKKSEENSFPHYTIKASGKRHGRVWINFIWKIKISSFQIDAINLIDEIF
jgi:hypothetical protein